MQRQGVEKVLRACVVQGGKVIEEQRLEPRAPLSIGSAPKNTFTVSDPSLPRSHRLFEAHATHYELSLTDGMRGKISSDKDPTPVDFATLKSQGLLKKRGDFYILPLTDGHRGKVIIGDITVIFQFVVPPPKPKAPSLPDAARVSIWKRFDWVMAAFILGFFALESPVIAAFYMMPPSSEMTLDTIDERWAKLIVPDRKAEDVKPAKDETKGTTKVEQASKQKQKQSDDQMDDAGRAKAKAARSAEIRKSIASKGILAVLGTTGEGSGGAVADVLSQGGIGGDLDAAFQGISGVAVATGAGQRTTRGGGSGEAASIGGLATAGGGSVGLGGKRESSVGSVRTEAPEVDGALDSEAIAKVVRSRMRMVQDCYERELKRDPSLSGKIEIEFTIGADGSVTEARVSNNKMGSNEVGACIVGRIQRWKFPKPEGGSVTVNFPFIFTPSG